MIAGQGCSRATARGVGRADGPHLIRSQFAARPAALPVTGRRLPRPVPDAVLRVLAAGVPPEVGEPVVYPVPVGVTALHAFGTRADEHRQDQPVDRPDSSRHPVAKGNAKVAAFATTPRPKSAPFAVHGQRLADLTRSAPHRPVRPDPVVGEFRDKAVHDRIIRRSHRRALSEGCLVVRPAGCVCTTPAGRLHFTATAHRPSNSVGRRTCGVPAERRCSSDCPGYEPGEPD